MKDSKQTDKAKRRVITLKSSEGAGAGLSSNVRPDHQSESLPRDENASEPGDRPAVELNTGNLPRDSEAQRTGHSTGLNILKAATEELTLPPQGAQSKPLRRRSFVDDMPDRGLFLTFTVIGAGLILFLKLSGVPTWPVASGAVGGMLLYGFISYRLPAVRLRLDRLGDNLYYMGFIFTLASMAAVLLQIDRGMEVEALLGGFGIALTSTMAGIIGRVFFVQMRSEVDDVEARIKRDVIEAGDQLRSQLSVAIRDLESFRIGTQQILQERLEQSMEKYTEASVRQVQLLGTTAEEIMGRVETAFSANHNHAVALNSIAQKTVEAADRLLLRISDINPPPDILERKIGGLATKLEASAKAFVGASAADEARQKTLAEVGSRLEAILAQLGGQLRGFEGGFQSIAQAGRDADGLAKAIEDLTTRLTSLARTISTQDSDLSEAIGIVRRQLEADLSSSRQAVLDVQRALAETARVITSEIKGMSVQ